MPQKPPFPPVRPPRAPAPHIQVALRAAQAKLPPAAHPGPPGHQPAPPHQVRPPAEHVRRALAPAQAKLPAPPAQGARIAPHVRNAIALVQAKPAQTMTRAIPSAPGKLTVRHSPSAVLQPREIAIPRLGSIRTEDYTEQELYRLIPTHLMAPGTYGALESLDAALENNEFKKEEDEGVLVRGALGSLQADEIKGWANRGHGSKHYDNLADQIFALRTDVKRALPSSVTGAIGITCIPERRTGFTVVFLAQQAGKTKRDMEQIKALLAEHDFYPIAMDVVSGSPMHAEMTIIANMLEQGIPLDSLERVGVAGGKGCCRLCSGVLSKLGVGYSHTKASAWEEQTWQDPWGRVGKNNPYLTTSRRF
jgi:hypothetical protein